MSVASERARAADDPAAFWGEAASGVRGMREPDVVLSHTSAGEARWFAGGELNTCDNALDRHVDAGRGDQAALIYDSPVTGARRTYSYAQLLDDVAAFAGAL